MMFLRVETDGCAGYILVVPVLRMGHGLKKCVAFKIVIITFNSHIRFLCAVNVVKSPAMRSK